MSIVKVALDIHLLLITKTINLLSGNGYFPDDLRLAEISPIFKKNDDRDKETYRPVSVFYLMFQRSLKESFTVKLIHSCKIN